MKKTTVKQYTSDENQLHEVMMLREGGTFWYTILRGLWDFGYQLELNQEKQQKHLEQVSFTQKNTQRSMGCNKFEENFHMNSNLTMPQRIPPVKKPLPYDTRGNSIRRHVDLIGYRGNCVRENPVNIMSVGKSSINELFLLIVFSERNTVNVQRPPSKIQLIPKLR